MKPSTPLFILFASLLDNTAASCAHGTTLMRRETYLDKRAGTKSVAVSTFGYFGTQGPTNWASLSPNNTACSTSNVQSPIDITTSSTTALPAGSLKITIPSIPSAEFENLGSTIEVVIAEANASTVIEGKAFALKQFHFHTPSEHTIEGEHFPLEMHMVHQADDKSLAVIGILFQLSEDGSTTDLLTSVTENISEITTPGSITETGPLDFCDLVDTLSSQDLSTYTGSLTTPPCTSGPTFYITTIPLPLDVKTYNAMKGVMGMNSRFTQNVPGEENLLSLSRKGVAAMA